MHISVNIASASKGNCSSSVANCDPMEKKLWQRLRVSAPRTETASSWLPNIHFFMPVCLTQLFHMRRVIIIIIIYLSNSCTFSIICKSLLWRHTEGNILIILIMIIITIFKRAFSHLQRCRGTPRCSCPGKSQSSLPESPLSADPQESSWTVLWTEIKEVCAQKTT